MALNTDKQCGDVKWPSWRPELPVNQEFVEQFASTDNKETSNVRVTVHCAGNPPVTSKFHAK